MGGWGPRDRNRWKGPVRARLVSLVFSTDLAIGTDGRALCARALCLLFFLPRRKPQPKNLLCATTGFLVTLEGCHQAGSNSTVGAGTPCGKNASDFFYDLCFLFIEELYYCLLFCFVLLSDTANSRARVGGGARGGILKVPQRSLRHEEGRRNINVLLVRYPTNIQNLRPNTKNKYQTTIVLTPPKTL